MRVLLISTYELGRQPFGLASPAAWLLEAGARVRCLDLAVEPWDDDAVREADLVAFHLPMHTATRLATRLAPRVKALHPGAHLCFFGLYAAMNERFLRGLGADSVLGGEFEEGLFDLATSLRAGSAEAGVPGADRVSTRGADLPDQHRRASVSLAKQRFRVPDRSTLPPLARYARLVTPDGEQRITGYTEASRGCKHRCRHCPIVPVYDGRFRIVERDVVLADVRRQVAAGAEHVTFGDPDFWNGIRHARELVRALHDEHPRLTYDVTIKIEHLLRHASELPLLRETGCVLVTTAAESIDDRVLALLDKGHTRADFVRALDLCSEAGVPLSPTFVAFTPWIDAFGYRDLLDFLEEHDLVENVAPVQLAIRLLVPAGSRLLEVEELARLLGPFDPTALVHPWRHPDALVDQLQAEAQSLVHASSHSGASRQAVFTEVRALADETVCRANGRRDASARGSIAPRAAADRVAVASVAPTSPRRARAAVPYLTEPWYC